MEAVNDMPETWKTVFTLKEVHHCSLREIAEISGYPLNSVKVYLMRARQSLQDHIRTLQNTPATS
jgi:DNA-directed RNA polymerase specialized sigma24 family protein